MKSYFLFLITMTLVSFTTNPSRKPVNANASQELATQLIKALQSGSADAYLLLIPSLADFKKVMEENSAFYGNNLIAAQQAFARDYSATLIPAVRNSFEGLIAEGKRRGINWKQVSLVSWETNNAIEQGLSPAIFVIAIEAQNKIYRIEIEKAFYWQGQWKASQFIKLV